MSSSTSSSYTMTRRVGSVYGGAGGSGVRISGASDSYSSFGNNARASCFSIPDVADNKKHHMQNLNDRLATYLQKVHSLEKDNSDLELKIRQFLESQATPEARDYTEFNVRIRELESKISLEARANAALILAIDNAKLATEDFKVKLESERAMCQTVEADIATLRKLLDDLTLSRASLEAHVEALREDLVVLKKTHEGDVLALQAHVGSQVNVEVDAAPQEDLSAAMASIREHYEAISAKNREDLEAWFTAKSAELSSQVAISSQTLQSSKSEITELRRTVQELEINLHSGVSMKGALEESLCEIQVRYSQLLAGLQMQVSGLEEQLGGLRADLAAQGTLYSDLLDVKTRLELEIAQYSRLLDGDLQSPVTTKTTTTTTKVVTIIQEVDSDGHVITTEQM